MILSKRTKLMFIGSTLVGLLMAVAVNFTGLCRLEAVTLNGQPLAERTGPYALLSEESLARQPLTELADQVLEQPDVYRVEIELGGLRSLDVITNRYKPRALLLDRSSGHMLGLDDQARVLPLDNATLDWECPVITGLKAPQRFTVSAEQGLVEMLRQLKRVEEDHVDFYRVIEEIHFGSDGSVTLATAGLQFKILMYPDQVEASLDRFIEFHTRFDTDLSGLELVDMRFGKMIVTREEG